MEEFGVLRLARCLLECQQTLSRHTDGAAIRLVPPDAVDGRVLRGKTLAEMGGPPHQPNTLAAGELGEKPKASVYL